MKNTEIQHICANSYLKLERGAGEGMKGKQNLT